MVIDADGKVKDGEGEKASTGSLKIDPDKKPKTLDLIYTAGRLKGHTYLAIYEIDGDTLRICSAHTGGGRPTEFTAKAGSNCALVILKREKPGAGAGKK